MNHDDDERVTCPKHGQSLTRRRCRTCNAAYMREYMRHRRRNEPAIALLGRAKDRSRARGLAYSLDRTDVDVPSHCPVLGLPLKTGGARSPNSASIDRIDPSAGYGRGNVRVISDRANRLKSNRSLPEILERSKTGRRDLRADYGRVAQYVEREALLKAVWRKARQGGPQAREWLKVARFLDRIFAGHR